MLQRTNRQSEVVLLHISLAEADKSIRKIGIEFGDFSKLSDGHVELMLLVGRDPGLHVLRGLGRQSLQRQQQRQ